MRPRCWSHARHHRAEQQQQQRELISVERAGSAPSKGHIAAPPLRACVLACLLACIRADPRNGGWVGYIYPRWEGCIELYAESTNPQLGVQSAAIDDLSAGGDDGVHRRIRITVEREGIVHSIRLGTHSACESAPAHTHRCEGGAVPVPVPVPVPVRKDWP